MSSVCFMLKSFWIKALVAIVRNTPWLWDIGSYLFCLRLSMTQDWNGSSLLPWQARLISERSHGLPEWNLPEIKHPLLLHSIEVLFKCCMKIKFLRLTVPALALVVPKQQYPTSWPWNAAAWSSNFSKSTTSWACVGRHMGNIEVVPLKLTNLVTY